LAAGVDVVPDALYFAAILVMRGRGNAARKLDTEAG